MGSHQAYDRTSVRSRLTDRHTDNDAVFLWGGGVFDFKAFGARPQDAGEVLGEQVR